jgi:hypothetical protein
LPRPHHVRKRIVADVQHLLGADARHLGERGEDARIGLGRAGGDRGDVSIEQMTDSAAREISVAVA